MIITTTTITTYAPTTPTIVTTHALQTPGRVLLAVWIIRLKSHTAAVLTLLWPILSGGLDYLPCYARFSTPHRQNHPPAFRNWRSGFLAVWTLFWRSGLLL